MKGNAVFRKTSLALFPASKEARDILAKIGEGRTVLVEVWEPRNLRQHRKYFAILNNVVEATARWHSVEDLSFDIMIALKRGSFHTAPDGTAHFRPDSRAVASMPKAEFERLYDDTMALLTRWLGCDPEMLLEEAA